MIGFLILSGLIFLEIVLFFKAKQFKTFNFRVIRNIRILSLSILFMLTLLGLITWSFRYYGLFLMFAIMITVNHIKLINVQIKSKPFTYKSILKNTILKILLFSLMMVPSGLFPEYKPLATTGPYEVKMSTYVFEDYHRIETFSNENEFRLLNVKAWTPNKSDMNFPLIIYSHGGISVETSNESLFLELASHGYVVFSVGHPYHSIVTKNSENRNIWIDGEYMKELSAENAKEDPHQSHMLYQKWMQLRTDDLNFIIDYAIKETKSDNTLPIFKMLNVDKIAVMGHSLGGSAALCLGRTRNDVKAVIALESPYMCDIIDVDHQGFIFETAIYPTPVLNIYSDSTWNQLSVLPQYKQNNLMLTDQVSDVKNLHIDGTGHFSLTDLSLTSPIMARLLNGFRSTRNSRGVLAIINKESLAFFNQYLK
jgi:acetyl esterase/lipase